MAEPRKTTPSSVPLVSQMKFNDQTVTHLKAGSRHSVWDDSLPCFGIRINRQSKTYVLKQHNRYITLGRVGIISLKQAREEARRRLALKYFPQFTKPTEEAVDDYLKAKEGEHSPNTRRVFQTYLKRLKNPPLAAIDAKYAYSCLPQSKSAANLAFKVFKAFLSWCVDREHLDHNPLLNRKTPFKHQSRDRLLTDEEVRLIWQESYNHAAFGVLLRVLVLTGQRLNQIASLQRQWLVQDQLIVFPPYVMKSGAEHILPLTAATQRILCNSAATFPTSTPPNTAYQELQPVPLQRFSSPNATPYLWGDKPFSNVSGDMKRFRAALPQIPHWTLHDFRRFFSSTMARLAIPLEVTERILDHRTGSMNTIARTYNRHSYLNEMRSALELYQRHVLAIIQE